MCRATSVYSEMMDCSIIHQDAEQDTMSQERGQHDDEERQGYDASQHSHETNVHQSFDEDELDETCAWSTKRIVLCTLFWLSLVTLVATICLAPANTLPSRSHHDTISMVQLVYPEELSLTVNRIAHQPTTLPSWSGDVEPWLGDNEDEQKWAYQPESRIPAIQTSWYDLAIQQRQSAHKSGLVVRADYIGSHAAAARLGQASRRLVENLQATATKILTMKT
ncbi:hypothetical protein MPSEU_001105800 [Mayamaea pseudoterrestris]|nr:hypothetical protein MPSEU_001105800 [Mayamaea pseudoterrestris]